MVVVLRSEKWTVSLGLLVVVLSLVAVGMGFSKWSVSNPVTLYNVYLDGKVIGTVESEEEFNSFINIKEEAIKDKYGVSKVYMPDGVNIQKVVTYDKSVDSNSVVYNRLIAENNFTIKCYIITITDTAVDSESGEESKTTKEVYVLSKDIFDEAITSMVKAFVGEEEYQNYIDDTQKEIEDTGSIIESIEMMQEVSYRVGYVSTDNKIFTNSDELSKYLLYGVYDDELSTYIVKEGDTISDVASANSLNVNEFLIANPVFSSENNLLYTGQEVVVGLIDPVIDIEVIVHDVSDETATFTVETQYDETQLQTYQKVVQEGEDGLNRVTRKYQYINGQIGGTQNVSTTVLKPAVNKVVVKGSRVAPHIADLSYWAWPTDRPYTITTYYGYRWGSMHGAIDIAGTGYGSGIYAANNGRVIKVGTGCRAGSYSCNGGRGNYVIINHNIGNYYSTYMHLKDVYVYEGLTVERGQKIGTMGNSGYVVPGPSSSNPYAGTHLHFEMTYGNPVNGGGTTFDPLRLY